MRTKDSRTVLRGLGRSNAPRLPGALAQWKQARAEGHRVKIKDLKRQYNRIKKEHFPWTAEVTKCAPEQEFAHLSQALSNYFRMKEEGTQPKLRRARKDHEEAGFPHFKSKKHDQLSFYLNNDKFRVEGQWLSVPKLGKVNMTESLRFAGKILSATISEQAGHWVRHVGACEIPVKDRKGQSNTFGSRDLPEGEIWREQQHVTKA